jgi:hypothetical protein
MSERNESPFEARLRKNREADFVDRLGCQAAVLPITVALFAAAVMQRLFPYDQALPQLVAGVFCLIGSVVTFRIWRTARPKTFRRSFGFFAFPLTAFCACLFLLMAAGV